METTVEDNGSINHIWERFNRTWWLTGVLSGIGAGLISILAACMLTAKSSGEFLQALKFLGSILVGPEGMTSGSFGLSDFAGLGLHLGLSSLFGITFAQLVNEQSKKLSFVILGVVCSLVIWVFGWCLFMPSFNLSLKYATPIPVGLALHVLFGLSFGVIIGLIRPLFIKAN